jgi:7-cyano-7-deazaguanine synthase in queuosine biosynthesis
VEAPRSAALIINSGTLSGLVACWAEGVVRQGAAAGSDKGAFRTAAPLAWFGIDDRPARLRRREAVERQVQLCGLSGVLERQLVRFEAPPAASHSAPAEALCIGARTTAMLVSAAIEAASLGLSRVIWPVHAGAAPEVDTSVLADVCDRALMVGQLVGQDLMRVADAGVLGIRIETPYADLTDAELMDLALDMDVPLGACWWCLNEDKDMCGQCSGCMRWREALLAVDPAGRLDIRVLATQSLKTV